MEKEYTKVPTKEIEIGLEKQPEPLNYGFGVRHVQTFIIFITHTLAYLSRAHLGVTIVAMTNEVENTTETTDIEINNLSSNTSDTDSVWNIYRNSVSSGNLSNPTLVLPFMDTDFLRTYDWPKSTQEMVLSSFFVGYFIMTFLSGFVCQRWGGKIPLQVSMLVNGVVSIVSPWVVAWGGWKALSACRILQGLSQGGMLPGVQTLLSNWAPLSERGSLTSYVYTGSGLGTVIGFQFSGLLAYSRFGWPATFWTIGLLSLLGFAIISMFGAATPNDHKKISAEEKNYIIGGSGQGTKTQSKVPWKAILTSKHVWATFLTHIGTAMSYTFFFIQVPTYMYAILKVNIKNSGLLSSMPHFSFVIFCSFFGYLSDKLVNKNIITRKNARRLANSISSYVAGICLCLVSFTDNVTVAVICFVTALGAHAAMHAGWVVNYIDLSPNYSGALMATGNGLANLCVLITPILVSNIVRDVTNQIQWRITMFIIGGIVTIGNTIFVLFLSTDVQPWNERNEEPEKLKSASEKETLKK